MMSANKIVSLPLSEAGKKTILTKLSADGYFSWMISVLSPFDLLYTYFFRYARVAWNDMINAQHSNSTDYNGPAIAVTMAHPDVGVAVTISFIYIAAVSSNWEVERQVKIKNVTSVKYVYDQLKTVLAEQKSEADWNEMKRATEELTVIRDDKEEKVAPPTAANDLDHTYNVDNYIQFTLQQDTHYLKKYKSIEFIGEDLQVELNPLNLQPIEPEPERVIQRETGQDTSGPDVARDELITPTAAKRRQSIPGPVQEPSRFQEFTENAKKFASNAKTFLENIVINKLLYPVWQSVILMSFVYWIEWIGFGIFTGNFYPWGVTGLPIEVALGFPVVCGLIYPAIKIYNYFNNSPAPSVNPLEPTPAEKEATEKDMSILLRRALARREFIIEKNAVEKELAKYEIKAEARNGRPVPNGYESKSESKAADEIEIRNGMTHSNGLRISPILESKSDSSEADEVKMSNGVTHANGLKKDADDQSNGGEKVAEKKVSQLDKEILTLRGGQWVKPFLEFFSVATGSYVAAQYCTWVLASLTNLLLGEAARMVVLHVAAVPLIVGTVLYGLYKAGETYNKVVGQHPELEKLQHQDEFVELEERLAECQKKLGGKPAPLKKTPVDHLEAQYFADVSRRGPGKYTTLNKIGARLYQFINGGCTGIFLARVFFVQGSAISLPFFAATLAFPVTAAVLIGIGTGYGLIKTLEYHLARKDRHAKNLLATRTERLEYLEYEVQVAELRVKLSDAQAHQARAGKKNGVRATDISVSPKPRQGLRFFPYGDKTQVAPLPVVATSRPTMNGMSPSRSTAA